jgi:outer membrane protein OmpA-like peptidoglycan-associated protein
VRFNAEAKGSNEVPPLQSAGSGTIVATFDPATRILSWTITFSGLSPTAMHFHGPADATHNAGISLLIAGNLTSPTVGSATLTTGQAADLMSGRWYLNVHSAANPAGELRAQMVSIPPAPPPAQVGGVPNRAAPDAAAKAAQEAAAKAAQAAAAKAAQDAAAAKAAQDAAAAKAAQDAAAATKATQDAAAAKAAQDAAAAKAAREAAAAKAAQEAAAKTDRDAAAKPVQAPIAVSACQTDLTAAAAKSPVLFKARSATARVAKPLVDAIKAVGTRCPTAQIEVAVHTDPGRNEDRNKLVSQQRAQAVVDSLVKAGVDRSKLTAVGYGSSKPAGSNDTGGRNRSRPIEFFVRDGQT